MAIRKVACSRSSPTLASGTRCCAICSNCAEVPSNTFARCSGFPVSWKRRKAWSMVACGRDMRCRPIVSQTGIGTTHCRKLAGTWRSPLHPGVQRQRPLSLVAVQPTRPRPAQVAHRMHGTGGDQQLLAGVGAMPPTLELELHVALHNHHQLIHVVGVVVPDLARRIHPQVAGKTPPAPCGG